MKIKVIQKKVGESTPKVVHIEDGLESLQLAVGGNIEVVPFFPKSCDNVLLICDEEGKLKGKSPNFFYGNGFIVGDVIFASSNGENISSLDSIQIKAIMALFQNIWSNIKHGARML